MIRNLQMKNDIIEITKKQINSKHDKTEVIIIKIYTEIE